METPVLFLDRFCGREVYPIIRASWNLYQSEQLGLSNLCLLIDAGYGTVLHEDSETLAAKPQWEVNCIQSSLDLSSLTPGAHFTVPDGYNESQGGYVTNLYYCEHEVSDNHKIEIVKREGDQLLIRMTGETIDINFYDGSKPPTILSVETWFKHDPMTMRSMS
ncbi:MAG: hypothetical protein QM703_14625 [Gemmatales bacterium]